MSATYTVRLGPRTHSNLALKSIGRIFTPNQTYTLSHADLQDHETQRAIKDGRLVVLREHPTQTHPMYLTDKDWKKLEALTSRIIASIQSESKAIQAALQHQKQIGFDVPTPPRARTSTRFDETRNGGLFVDPTPASKAKPKRPPRPDAQYVATPTDRPSSLTIEETRADGVGSAVEALRKMRGEPK